ncbi:MAG: preprotein translocase subunit YajC [Alphaproteobacteria bacterium]|nr:preprotein translocase subunit YajC [Alphaproteobacteria bacterium]
MFISPAWASSAQGVSDQLMSGAPQGPGFMVTMLPLLLVFIVFFMMVIRPQNKRIEEHRKMIANLQKGDKVVTGGGLVATVKKLVGDEEVILEIAPGVECLSLRQTIMTVRDSAHMKEVEKAQKRDAAKSKG